MAHRTLLCAVLWVALAAFVAAQPIALKGGNKRRLVDGLQRRGYTIVRDSGADFVWAELPEDKAKPMREAVDVATAAAVDGVTAAAADSPGARGKDDSRGQQWRTEQAASQAARLAARPFQTAAFEELKADGLADTFEAANL
jgi:hypothetical protein